MGKLAHATESSADVAPDTDRLRQVNLRMPETLVVAARRLAERRGLTFAEFVTQLVDDAILLERDAVASSFREAAAQAQREAQQLDEYIAERERRNERAAAQRTALPGGR